MSVVIFYVSDHISLVATDTRLMKERNKYDDYNDNVEKLHDVNLGWITGVGFNLYINDVSSRINTAQIKNRLDILNIYKDVRNEFINNISILNEDIDLSAIAVSTVRIDKNKEKRFEIMNLSKRSVEGNAYHAMPKSEISFFYPMDFIDNKYILNEKFNLKETYSNDNKLYEKVFNIFKFIHENSKTVSNICDIGILLNINGELFKSRIKGNIDDLIHALKNDELSKYTIMEKY